MELCGLVKRHFPAREYKHRRVTPECVRKHFRALNTQMDTTILDCRNGGLWNACERRKLALA